MATLEMERTQTPVVENEAQLHNSMIRERFRRLQDAEADQFATGEPQVRASISAPVAPAPVRETRTMQQTPQVTEYVRPRIETPVFTTEKFEGIQNATATIASPVYAPAPVAPMQVGVYQPVATETVEESYTISSAAKKALAIFGSVVTIMLTVIGVNTQIINGKTAKIRNLENQRQELQEEYEELQERIKAAQSEETIREYATSKGMIQAQG